MALLAEGLLEKLDPQTLGTVARDATATCAWRSWSWRGSSRQRVAASLAARGIGIGIVAKDLGYELRCAPPGGFDIQYCRSLGYWATRFLLDGGTEAMATIQGGRLVPIPFADLLDPRTGKIRVRYADIHSEAYRTLHAYMIRLKREDFERPDQREALAGAANLSEPEFVHRFGYVAGYDSGVPDAEPAT